MTRTPDKSTKVQPQVYAVIPTFNRLRFTRNCVKSLGRQDGAKVLAIVSDGGSSDGTPQAIRQEFPSSVVLESDKNLWWGGAMARGIHWALNHGACGDDYILMLNDDTEFESDLVQRLVKASGDMDAAVAAMTLDSQDRTCILDAGTYLNWVDYRYLTITELDSDSNGRYDVDVLPGRATLVPVRMIMKAGNVDSERFPHYLADYEFFYRLKSHGFRIGVTYTTYVASHSEMTGLSVMRNTQYSLRERMALLGSRRSMYNVLDHLRFVMRWGPKGRRTGIVIRAAARLLFKGLGRKAASPVDGAEA